MREITGEHIEMFQERLEEYSERNYTIEIHGVDHDMPDAIKEKLMGSIKVETFDSNEPVVIIEDGEVTHQEIDRLNEVFTKTGKLRQNIYVGNVYTEEIEEMIKEYALEFATGDDYVVQVLIHLGSYGANFQATVDLTKEMTGLIRAGKIPLDINVSRNRVRIDVNKEEETRIKSKIDAYYREADKEIRSKLSEIIS